MGPIKNGGVATACTILSEFLAKKYGSVDVLLVHLPTQINKQELEIWTYEYAQKNIKLLPLVAPKFEIRQNHLHAALSYVVFQNLKKSKYDIIIFPEMYGLAHYCLWAQKTGVAFQNTKLVVMYHGPKEWHYRYNASIPTHMSDLVTFHLEKFSCQMANHVFYATEHSRRIAESLDYKPHNPNRQSEVILFPYRRPGKLQKVDPDTKKIKEICFFGRVETRKGIKTFLNALTLSQDFLLKNNIQITFLGSLGHIDPFETRPFLEKWSKENLIPIKIYDDKNQTEALEYLIKKNCLAVLPSLEETMGYTLIECITHRIPFVCSDIDSFREILNHFNLNIKSSTFSTEKEADLAKAIISKIRTVPTKTQFQHNYNSLEKSWTRSLEKLFHAKNIDTNNYLKNSSRATRLLSVCIVHKDRPIYLQELLTSLIPLDDLIGEILIVDNGSTTGSAQKFIKSISRLKKINVTWNNSNKGPSLARNELAAKCKFENILFIDDDNIIDAKVFRRIYLGLPQRWDTVVAPLKAFLSENIDPIEIKKNHLRISAFLDERVLAHQPPIGNTLSLNLLENANGDANFLVKRDHFLAINGFDPNLRFGEDQAFLIKSRIHGGVYQLCPDPFVFYRRHSSNLTSSAGPTNVDYTQLINSIAASTQFPELADYILMSLAWRFEKNRHDNVHELYGWMHAENQSTQSTDQRGLSSLFHNELQIFKKSMVLVLNKSKKKSPINMRPTTKNPKLKLTLNLFTEKSGLVYVNKKVIKLETGSNTIEVRIHSNKAGLLFFESKALTHLYIKSYQVDKLPM